MPKIPMPYTVHLDHTMRVTPLNTLFSKGDNAAHRFELTILRAGVQDELTGCNVVCKFYRMADSIVVSVPGSVEDGKAVAVLDAACYDYIGRFALTIAIQNGEEETTVFYGDGYMHGQSADTSISGDYIIYDINTLLEKISEIDAATQEANTAASNANTATGNANTATTNANNAANNAKTQAEAAKSAAAAANAAAKNWGDSTAANSEKLGGKAPEYYLQPRNLLDNSDFTNPVNQRGEKSYPGNGYAIDRWTIRNKNVPVTLGKNGLTISNNRSDNTDGYMEQVLPDNVINSTDHAGKSYTIAAKVNGIVYCATGTIPNGTTIQVDSANTIMLIYSNSAEKWVVRFIVKQSGKQMTIAWVALYEGSYTADTLPPYVPKGYAAELAECQRYFQVYNNTYHAEGMGYAYSSSVCRFIIPTPQTLRIDPSIESVQGDLTSYNIKVQLGGNSITPTSVSAKRSNNRILLTIGGAFTEGAVGVLRLESNLKFSADL